MRRLLLAAVPLLLLSGCTKQPRDDEPLTLAEAGEALVQAGADAQAQSLVASSVEITTSFTIGQAVEDAAKELKAFIESQLPCADVVVTGSTLDVTYGVKDGSCTYHGHAFTGHTSVTVTKDDEGEVVVDHVWDDLSNGIYSVTGVAKVTWSFADPSRHVEHTLTWTKLDDGLSATGSGDRVQRPLSGGIEEGIRVDGDRQWTEPKGTWDLAIDAVEMRWVDPVPQAGTYSLTTPKGKTLVVAFDRKDGDTITVTISGTQKSFAFDVTAAGLGG